MMTEGSKSMLHMLPRPPPVRRRTLQPERSSPAEPCRSISAIKANCVFKRVGATRRTRTREDLRKRAGEKFHHKDNPRLRLLGCSVTNVASLAIVSPASKCRGSQSSCARATAAKTLPPYLPWPAHDEPRRAWRRERH